MFLRNLLRMSPSEVAGGRRWSPFERFVDLRMGGAKGRCAGPVVVRWVALCRSVN